MATEKVFLPALIIFLILFLNWNAQGSFDTNKYNQTSNYFLDTNSTNFITIKEAIDFTSELLKGDVTKAERKFIKDIPVWKVDVITPERGSFKTEISAADGSLIRIDADEGPFEYEVMTGGNFIPFSAAKETAEKMSGQKTLKWNFFKNKNNWEYNFWLFIKSGKAQVRIDAESGDIVTSRKKK